MFSRNPNRKAITPTRKDFNSKSIPIARPKEITALRPSLRKSLQPSQPLSKSIVKGDISDNADTQSW